MNYVKVIQPTFIQIKPWVDKKSEREIQKGIHLYDTEKDWLTAGTEKVLDTEIGRIGLFICYDASFPEVSRILAIKGAELLVHSTNWNKPDDYDMDMYVSVRALENTVYIACCNRIGKDKSLDFFGQLHENN